MDNHTQIRVIIPETDCSLYHENGFVAFFLSNQETPSSKTTVIVVDTICRYYIDTLFGKKVFLGILQNSQESTYARVSLIIKLQA